MTGAGSDRRSGPLAELIRKEVQRQSLTLHHVAQLVREAARRDGGYSRAHEQLVCKWRSGEITPGTSHVRWLAFALGLPVELLATAAHEQRLLQSYGGARRLGGRGGDEGFGVWAGPPGQHTSCDAVWSVSAVATLNTSDKFSNAEAVALDSWIRSTNASDEAVEYLNAVTSLAAQEHLYQPTATVLSKTMRIHRQVRALLQGGRQRLRQSRELFRIEAALSAHICLLFGDIRRHGVAEAYGAVALLAAEEAGCSPAEAFSARAQIARWRHHYDNAADLAYRGWESSPAAPIRVLLASQEANAAALAGDTRRARRALARAELAYLNAGEEGRDSAWSCPPGRQALYRLSVALHSGDTTAAFREAELAAGAWEANQPRPFGTWAHILIAAAHAQLIAGALDRATEQIAPVLELPREYRLATLTEHLAGVEKLLQHRRYRGSRDSGRLREPILEFKRSPAWRKT